MKTKPARWAGIWFMFCLACYALASCKSLAVTNSTDVAYALLSGSELSDECPVCGAVTAPVPIYGTFRLHLVEATPLYGTYDLMEISFQTATNSTRQYTVNGAGTYQYGGADGMIQNAFLNLMINDGSKNTRCYCTNLVQGKGIKWPAIQINAIQTNGTAAQEFHLKIIAMPVPQITAVIPDTAQGNVRLEWTANGQQVLVEKAESVTGPYNALSDATTNEYFTDSSSLTNRSQAYYRLRLW